MKAQVVCEHPDDRSPRHQLCPACKETQREVRLANSRAYNATYYQDKKSDPAFIDRITAHSRSLTKEQRRAYSRAQRLRDPDGGRRRSIKHKYGISLQEYDQLLDHQKGACAICKTTPHTRLCIDHDHKTGRIRGLLCRKCNTAIGLLRESESNLLRAITYLRQETSALEARREEPRSGGGAAPPFPAQGSDHSSETFPERGPPPS